MDKSIRQLAEKLSALASGREQTLESEQLALALEKALTELEEFKILSEKEQANLLHALKEKEDKIKYLKEHEILSW
jgi:transposase-like protein